MQNEYFSKKIFFLFKLTSGPGVARGNKIKNLKYLEEIERFDFYLAYVTPRLRMSVHKKCQPVRSSCLAGYWEHVYECLVLFHRFRIVLFLFSSPRPGSNTAGFGTVSPSRRKLRKIIIFF